MPFYPILKSSRARNYGLRATRKLLKLRKQLRRDIPQRTLRDTLLLATWNIRDFDSGKWGHGKRLPESFHYIAEIIAAFDLVALQEVNEDLEPLERVKKLLGENWDYLVTDVTEGQSGNDERMAFVYDKRKVRFSKVVGEVVLPDSQLIPGGANAPGKQFARTPFLASFQAGWFKFSLVTAHLYYGATSGANYQRRVEEIRRLGEFFADRADRELKATGSYPNYILLGDFNIVDPEDDTMTALEKTGWTVPQGIHRSNVKGDKYYDQIAFRPKEHRLKLGPSNKNSGVFKFFENLFTKKDFSTYSPLMASDKAPDEPVAREKYYLKDWRTWQISDHYPLWVELEIDFSDDYLLRVEEQLKDD